MYSSDKWTTGKPHLHGKSPNWQVRCSWAGVSVTTVSDVKPDTTNLFTDSLLTHSWWQEGNEPKTHSQQHETGVLEFLIIYMSCRHAWQTNSNPGQSRAWLLQGSSHQDTLLLTASNSFSIMTAPPEALMCPMMIRSPLSDPNLCEDTGSPGAEDRHYGSEFRCDPGHGHVSYTTFLFQTLVWRFHHPCTK